EFGSVGGGRSVIAGGDSPAERWGPGANTPARRTREQRRRDLPEARGERRRHRNDAGSQPSLVFPADSTAVASAGSERTSAYRQRRVRRAQGRLDQFRRYRREKTVWRLASISTVEAGKHPVYLRAGTAAGGKARHGELPASRFRADEHFSR